MRRIDLLQSKEQEKKKTKRLAMEYARLNKELRLESPKFRKLINIKKILEI